MLSICQKCCRRDSTESLMGEVDAKTRGEMENMKMEDNGSTRTTDVHQMLSEYCMTDESAKTTSPCDDTNKMGLKTALFRATEDWRGDTIHMVFRLSNVPFTDHPVSNEEWKKEKSTCPLKSLPMLRVGSVEVAKFTSILRYVGTQGKLYPTDILEAAHCDVVLCVVDELIAELIPWTTTSCPKAKDILSETIWTETIMPKLEQLEAFLKPRLGPMGHWTCPSHGCTIADIALHQLVKSMSTFPHAIHSRVSEEHPCINRILQSVEARVATLS